MSKYQLFTNIQISTFYKCPNINFLQISKYQLMLRWSGLSTPPQLATLTSSSLLSGCSSELENPTDLAIGSSLKLNNVIELFKVINPKMKQCYWIKPKMKQCYRTLQSDQSWNEYYDCIYVTDCKLSLQENRRKDNCDRVFYSSVQQQRQTREGIYYMFGCRLTSYFALLEILWPCFSS